MRRFLTIFVWLAALAGFMAPLTAAQAADAPDVSQGDARGARAVILAQFDAFSADDAKRAFS